MAPQIAEVAPPARGSHPAGRAAPLGWPTADDVRQELRAEGLSADDDAVLGHSLDAAIAWITGRVRTEAIADDLGAVAVVPDVWLATVLEVCRLYRRRDSLDGTLGWGDAGLVRVGVYDPDVEHLLGQWVAIVL